MQEPHNVLELQPVTQERNRTSILPTDPPVTAERPPAQGAPPADRTAPADRPAPVDRHVPFDLTRDLRRAFEDGRRRGRQETIVTAIIIGVIAGLTVAAMIYGIIQSATVE
jgi:hypothetical protein